MGKNTTFRSIPASVRQHIQKLIHPPLGALIAVATLSGCANAVYAVNANSASARLEEAKELGAQQYAAYEYYMAEEYLKKARLEAANADYGDAIEFAESSEAHSARAIELSKNAHRNQGR